MLMAGLLSACQSSHNTKQIEQNKAIYATIQPQINPNPKERYEIIINTKNAPSDLILTRLKASYITQCRFYLGKSAWAVGGNYDIPKHQDISLNFKKVGNHEYRADVYDDYFLDKDYFNQGKPCGWKKPWIDAYFEPSPNHHRQSYHADVGVNISGLPIDAQGNFHHTYYLSLLNYNQPAKKQWLESAIFYNKNTQMVNLNLSPFKEKSFGGEHLNHLASVDIAMIKKF